MPELPEVETVKTGLNKFIVGKKILDIYSDREKSFPNSSVEINNFAIGGKIISIRRRAKLLIIDLDTSYSFVIHLKMTGQMVYRGNEAFGAGHPNDSLIGKLPDRSTRVIVTFKDKTKLFFNDQRKFGWMMLLPTAEIADLNFMKKVGPEPLEDDFTVEDFKARFINKKRSNIKAALLDQTTVAGVGNIYADESLWQAFIDPRRLVKDMRDEDWKNLYTAIRYVMKLSIEKGGSTDRNYVNAEGKRGSYMDFANVFRREGQACNRCGNIIIKIKHAGRGTHICEVCQK